MDKGKEAAANIPMPEESREQASASRNENEASTSTATRDKKRKKGTVRSGNIDFSSIPRPLCSCSGFPRECHKASDGWQSKCCTETLSQYPLPVSSTKKIGRVSGRRMSKGAFQTLIVRRNAEGYDLSCAIDLKNYWAKRGSNQYKISK